MIGLRARRSSDGTSLGRVEHGHLIVPLTTAVAQSFRVDVAPQGNPHAYSIVRACGVNVFEWPEALRGVIGLDPGRGGILSGMRTQPAFVLLCLAGCAATTRQQSIAAAPTVAAPTVAAPTAAAIAEAAAAKKLAEHALPILRAQWQRERSPFVAYDGALSAVKAGAFDEAFEWLGRAVDGGLDNDKWLTDDSDLNPLHGDPRLPPLVERARKNAAAAAGLRGKGLERVTPEQAGIDAAALARLLAAAEKSKTTGLVVLRDGKLVGEWTFGGTHHRTEAMSATKSVVSLAIGLLIDEGKIASVDQPLSTFFPAWSSGRKAKVTLRHLLNHTSGLQAKADTADIYAADDFVEYALGAEVSGEPGSNFFYNNKAVNLLAAVVRIASGERMDRYLGSRLFAPLGIEHVGWILDRSGNPHGMAGLQIHPIDFAKIGQLVLDGGVWQGKRVLSAKWVADSTAVVAQPYDPSGAMLWWLQSPDQRKMLGTAELATMKANGAPAAALELARPIVDRPLPSKEWNAVMLKPVGSGVLRDAVIAALVSPRIVFAAPPDATSAMGYFGQYVAIFPSRQLVVVRMADPTESAPMEIVNFRDFFELSRALVPERTAPR